jgi:Fe-S oxidoreductase
VPDIGSAIVEVLTRLGARVSFPRAQHCCGLSALDAGIVEPAKRMARQTIKVLEAAGGDYILTGGTSCAVAMLHDYPHLFRDEPEWKERSIAVGSRVIDFTTFLHTVARLPAGSLGSDRSELATYHYFCQSYNVLRFRDEPLRLLRDVCGVTLRPLEEANVCCGFGGSVSVTRPDMCRHILERKMANVRDTGAAVLITDNPGCIIHMRGAAQAKGETLRVRHTAEIVAECLKEVQTVRA